MSLPIASHPVTTSFGRLLNVEQVAELLGVDKRTIFREVARGHFPRPRKIGRTTRFPLSEVEAYVAKLGQTA
jgi:prophage regulatory protein